MNTPPPPLQPITDEAKNGLYHYFGQQNNQTVTPQPQQLSNLRHVPHQHNGSKLNDPTPLNINIGQEFNSPSPFLSSPYSPYHQSAHTNHLHAHELDSDFKEDDDDDDEDDRSSQISLQEKRQSLSRKLAQRRPKQELIERGILPPSRISNLQYNRMKHLEKAQLQDILRTKIEKRPNRELLVQKNILPDSAPKAAPALQLKCNELKRARLADDLNEKLAKRPGPLELVESGILVSSDSTLTEAIKDGKIQYPRTTTILHNKLGHAYHHEMGDQPQQEDLFNLDDSSLNYLNFNFNNLTDNDDSNASQTSTSTTKTNNTLASISSSATSFNINTAGNNLIIPQAPLQQQQQLMQTEIVNFNDFQFQSSNAPSPSSSTSTAIIKSSPSSSPFHNYDFLSNNTTNSTAKASTSKTSIKQKTGKSFSSASSTTSSTSTSSKTNKLQRNNSNVSAVSSTSSTNGPMNTTPANVNTNNNGTKKLSQLIFHEYRGPNQKSSKTSISLKPIAKSNPNNSNNTTQQNNNSTGLNSASANLNASLVNGQINTSEIFFDDSNDSANNNLNSAMMVDHSNSDHSHHRDELNPHKIRMKQQKIFLKYNNTTNSNLKDENNWDAVKAENNQMETSDLMTQQKQLNDKQHHLQPVTINNNNNSSQQNQSIQLVPIGDIMLFNSNNFLPIRTISVAPFNNNNEIQTSNNNILPPPPPPTPPTQAKLMNNHNSSGSNLYSLDRNNMAPLLITTRPSSTASLSQSLQSIPVNQYQQASPIKSASSEILPPPNHLMQKTPTLKLTDKTDKDKLINVDDMSLNELKEECRRRKLLVTGNKQKLIERIKGSLNGSNQLLHSGIKSPDSGVNMDSSPSFISNEQSPCSNSNLINKQRVNLMNENQSVKPAANTNGCASNPNNGSSLDDFFNLLDIENLGAGEVASKCETKTSETAQKQEIKQSDPKLNGLKPVNKCDATVSKEANQPDNITQTAATLEISLKSSAELLKQLSSTGHIEHLHLLEKQMRESMQFIERLKSASNTPKHHLPGQFEHLNHPANVEALNKLRAINSMPSNLRELELQQQQIHNYSLVAGHAYQTSYDLHTSTNSQMHLNESNSKNASESQHLMKLNIPLAKNNYDMNRYQYNDMNHSKLPANNGNNRIKEETIDRPFQFETMMKELNEKVTFTCNPPDDEDNSNETDSILTTSSKNKSNHPAQFNHIYHASSLPSIDNLIGQQQMQSNNDNSYKLNNNLSYDDKLNSKDHQHSDANNVEMEWNESDFLQFCQNLDETDHLFNNQKQTNVYANHQHQTASYMMHQTNQKNMLNSTNNLTFNDDTSILNFDMNHRIDHEYNGGNLMNDSGAKLTIDNNSNNINMINSANNNTNNNMIMPWEFDNDFNNQIATYLQSPTV